MCLLTSGFPAGKPARLQDVEASLQHGHRLTQTLSHSPLLACNSNQMCPDVLGCMESFLPVWLEHKCLNSEADLKKKKRGRRKEEKKSKPRQNSFSIFSELCGFSKGQPGLGCSRHSYPPPPTTQGRFSPCCSENEEKSRRKKKQQKTENRQLAHVLVFTIETTQL